TQTICRVCWDGPVDYSHAVVTYRGPWLNHFKVLCDQRKVYSCPTIKSNEGGHCACDGFVKLKDMKEDDYTTTYDNFHHSIQEVAILNTMPEQWDKLVIEAIKEDPNIGARMELLWSTVLYCSIIPAGYFHVKLNDIHRMTSLTAKMELAANRRQWLDARSEILENWSKIESNIKIPLAALCRRQMLEYICGRSQHRIACGNSTGLGEIKIHSIDDPLLKQMLGEVGVG
ncbi:hypothetical protein L0F63_004410, partial [Massospora cicadina]